MPAVTRTFATTLLLALATGCSIRGIAINSLAGAFTSGQDVFSTDDDPELVRAALPFGLKTMEALLLEAPENVDLLLATCRGFTQYSYAFVEGDAHLADPDDYAQIELLNQRALKLYLRARDYGLRGLELSHPGISQDLARDPKAAVLGLRVDDVDLTYWTAAAWGSAISLALDRPAIVADVDAVREMLHHALALDPRYGDGAIHQALISIEALPEMMGGSPERAREHMEAALAATNGSSAGAYVSYATGVTIGAQDRRSFEELLSKALAVDPDAHPEKRLPNLIAQRRARHLLLVADDLFFEPLD